MDSELSQQLAACHHGPVTSPFERVPLPGVLGTPGSLQGCCRQVSLQHGPPLLWPVSVSDDGCMSLLLGGPSGVLGLPAQLHMLCSLNHSPYMVSDAKFWSTGEGVPLSPAKLNGSDSSKSLPSPSSSPQPDWIASPTHDPQWCPSDPTDSSLSSLFGESGGTGMPRAGIWTPLALGARVSGRRC